MIKALVVDDDADLLDMISLMLQTNEIQVTALLDGMKFFDTLKSAIPDIIIMDIFLGNCDGRELCKELRSHDSFCHIPVILYTAADLSKDRLDNGCANLFMRKPFEMEQLLGSIRKLAA